MGQVSLPDTELETDDSLLWHSCCSSPYIRAELLSFVTTLHPLGGLENGEAVPM